MRINRKKNQLHATPASQPYSKWREVKKHFLANKPGVAGMVIVVLLLTVAVLAPVLANNRPVLLIEKSFAIFPEKLELLLPVRPGGLFFPALFNYDRYSGTDWEQYERTHTTAAILYPPVRFHPEQVDMQSILREPGGEHIMGTDNLGFDVFSRIIHGSRIAVSVGFIAMGIAAAIGISLGAMAGYYGGKTDLIISRIIEVVICFPTLFLILTILAFLPPSIYNIMVAIGLTGWTGIARLIRGEILKVKEMDYILAAKIQGIPNRRILMHHVIPNAIAPVFVSISFGIAGAILAETALSFLGFGVQPPTPSWGQILSLARSYPDKTYLALFPGLVIFITVTGFNLIGEAFRDALDPTLHKKT